MRVLWTGCWVILVFSHSNCLKTNQKAYLVARAINGVLESGFLDDVHTLNVINFGSQDGISQQILDQLLTVYKENTPIRCLKKSPNQTKRIKLKYSSILLFDSVADFEKIFENFHWQGRQLDRVKHLLFIDGSDLSTVKNIKNAFQIDLVNFLIHET